MKTPTVSLVRRGLGALAALLVSLSSGVALAHVHYYDLNKGQYIGGLTAEGVAANGGHDVPVVASTWDLVSDGVGVFTFTPDPGKTGSNGHVVSVVVGDLADSGWIDGTRIDPSGANILGDSHKVDFANFHLAQPSRVTIEVRDLYWGTEFEGVFGANPSFTVYRGLLVYQGHDDTIIDPLHPGAFDAEFNFVKLQNQRDTGLVLDWQGNLSPFRDTVGNAGAYEGQFAALGNWSQSNGSDWSAVHYVAHATGHANPAGTWEGSANSNRIDDLLLPAGHYTIAFSGAAVPADPACGTSSACGPYGAITGMAATLIYSAVAEVPPAVCGNSVVESSETCDDGNVLDGDCCSAGCQLEANGSACDDGDACTTGDTCSAGACGGGEAVECPLCEVCDPSSGCGARPAPLCGTAPAAGGGLQMTDATPDTKDKLLWTAKKGPATTFGALGNPDSGDGYALCVYDVSAAEPALITRLGIPAGGTCDGKPCWKPLGPSKARNGWKYADKNRENDGVGVLVVKSGAAGKSSASLTAGGPGLPVGSFAALPLPVRVQLQARGGACFETTFTSSDVKKNAAGSFKAAIK